MTRWAWLLLAVVCAWLMFAVPAIAEAATCSAVPADPDPLPSGVELQVLRLRQEQAATCIRLAELADASSSSLTAIEANTSGGGPTTVAGTVALSADDRERADLAWYGVWAVVGLLLVLMIAPYFVSLLRVERGL